MTSIHWTSAVDGKFVNSADWSAGVRPGAGDDAILDASGARFIVAATSRQTVNSVQLAANATLSITGGTFTCTAGTGAGANAGTISIGDGASLAVGGVVNDAGLISLDGIGDPTRLIVAADTTLTGGGTLTLGAYRSNQIMAVAGANVTLTNQDLRISGVGAIGVTGGALNFRNETFGVIDAGGVSLGMTIGPASGSGTLFNAGLIECTGSFSSGAMLTIQNLTVSGAGGRIIAGSGSKIELSNCVVSQQALTTAPNGQIEVSGSGTVTLGPRLDNAGQIDFRGAAPLQVTRKSTLAGGGALYLTNGATGAGVSAVLTNRDNSLVVNGVLGGGGMSLVNQGKGTIFGGGLGAAAVIDTGAATIVNAGLIESNSGRPLTIDSPIANSGKLVVDAATMTVNGDVTGAGGCEIAGGTLQFTSAFSEDVAFKPSDAASVLILAQSQAYTGQVSGFAARSKTQLDLRDIAFVSAGEVSFSGTSTSGVLTVTDGSHTASITLIGDYVGWAFTAVSDGQGGTLVLDPEKSHPASASAGSSPFPTHGFVAAMAGLGNAAGPICTASGGALSQPVLLSAPRVAIA